jgi:hypothetical protein
MAVYLDIKKSAETDQSVEYTYSTTDEHKGRFIIDRQSGETNLLECAEGESEESLYQRASFKIKKAWKAGKLPEFTCWAS